MPEQVDPITRVGRQYARFYPPLLVSFLVLTAFPLYHVERTDYGNIYHLAANGDGLSVLGILLLACYLAALVGAAIVPGGKGLPVTAAVLGAILVLMLALLGPSAYATAPPLTGTAGMAVFLGCLSTVLAVLHAVHVGVRHHRSERDFQLRLARRARGLPGSDAGGVPGR